LAVPRRDTPGRGVWWTYPKKTELFPILLRVLPPLAKDASTDKRDPDYAVTVLGLILYVAVVAGVLVLIDID
jgi:hypothetical protein